MALAKLQPESMTLRMRGKSLMALVLAPQFPVTEWFGSLDRELVRAGDFFRHRLIVADLSAAPEAWTEAPAIVLEGMEARGLRLAAVEGIAPRRLAGTRWEGLVAPLTGREAALETKAPEPAEPEPPSLLVESPVRSGQSIVFEAGDVTVVGAVASGAEVIAGGSIHIYGPLRGRAIAGLAQGEAARIFCTRLEAELVGVGQLYRTADNWGANLQGRAVQVRCDRGALRLSPLD
jgi:septum site-determining protein MinC